MRMQQQLQPHLQTQQQLQPPGIRIALGHQARVGKDAFADYVESKFPISRLRVAKTLYEVTEGIQRTLRKPVQKDPVLLQRIGDGLRDHYGSDVWLDTVKEEFAEIIRDNPSANVILVDMRYPNEMDWAEANGFITVKITRKNRVIDRPQDHYSEIALKGRRFDYYIKNNYSMEQYHHNIDFILSRPKPAADDPTLKMRDEIRFTVILDTHHHAEIKAREVLSLVSKMHDLMTEHALDENRARIRGELK